MFLGHNYSTEILLLIIPKFAVCNLKHLDQDKDPYLLGTDPDPTVQLCTDPIHWKNQVNLFLSVSLITSVVDPDPDGSAFFGQIRIRILTEIRVA